MANEDEIIRASFEGNGVFNKGKRCIYIVRFTNGVDTHYYVGKTGTSNQTGVNSPFRRLANHFTSKGKTKSCIFDKDENGMRVPSLGEEYYSKINFYAIYLNDDNDAKSAEKWLCGKIKGCGKKLLNRHAYSVTLISEEVKIKVIKLLRAAELNCVVTS